MSLDAELVALSMGICKAIALGVSAMVVFTNNPQVVRLLFDPSLHSNGWFEATEANVVGFFYVLADFKWGI